MLVTGLEDDVVCETVYTLANELGSSLVVRIETREDIPNILFRLPDARTRRMAKWLISHADQSPVDVSGAPGKGRPGRASAAHASSWRE